MLLRFLPMGIPLVFWVVTRLLGFEGVYGQDAYEYARYTEALTHFYQTGESPGDYYWPLLYPIMGSLLNGFLPVAVSLQLVSVVSFMGVVYLMQRILSKEFVTMRK